MPARLRIILLFFVFYFILEECQVCVDYLEITILTPVINIGVLVSIIIHDHIQARLLNN